MKHINRKQLQALYPPMPEATGLKLESCLSGLPAAEERIIVKRKFSAAVVLAAVLTLLAVGGLAAALNWDALTYLYGEEQPRLTALSSPVNQKAQAGGVTLEITSAVTDGHALAFDWTMTRPDAAAPLYLQVDALSVAGQDNVWIDTLAGLNRTWLPAEAVTRRSGELLVLDESVPVGESIRVELTVGVYAPRREVVLLPSPEDQAEARALRDAGVWAVAPVGEAPSQRTGGMAPLWRYHSLTQAEKADYDRTELCFAFEVPVTEVATQRLAPGAAEYSLPDGSFRITDAFRTPLTVSATVDIAVDGATSEFEARRKAQYYFFDFTDAQGDYLRGQEVTSFMPADECYCADGVWHVVRRVSRAAYDEEALPDGPCLIYDQGHETAMGYISLTRLGEIPLAPAD